MQMFAGHHGEGIDVRTIEGRTAASKRIAMLQEQIRHLTAAAHRAALMGNRAEAIRLKHQIQELGLRISKVEGLLASVSPLAGIAVPTYSGYGAPTSNSAAADLREKEATLKKARELANESARELKKLIGEVRDLQKRLDDTGALKLGKKSHLKDEIKEREAAIERRRNLYKRQLKGIEQAEEAYDKAYDLATNPEGVADKLEIRVARARTFEARYSDKLRAVEKDLKDLRADLDRAGALDLLKKNYLKDEIESKNDARNRILRSRGYWTDRLRALESELGKAKATAKAQAGKKAASLPPVIVKSAFKPPAGAQAQKPALTSTGPKTPLPAWMLPKKPVKLSADKASAVAQIVQRHGGSKGVDAVADIKSKVKADAMARQLADQAKQLQDMNERLEHALKAKKDHAAMLVMIQKARELSDTIRDTKFKRDEILHGKEAARANRLRADQNRVAATRTDIKRIEMSALTPEQKQTIVAKLREHEKQATQSAVASHKEIESVAAGRVKKLPKLKEVNANTLSNQKRQLSLKPAAKAPDQAMLTLLSQSFAAAVPPIAGEKPEDYVIRLKLYVARGAIVAANTQADGKPATEAVKEAVKDVVVQDAPAIEEEAAKKVTAPAGEQAVASAVNAAEATIVKAAIAAAPEVMAAAPSQAEQAAAELEAAKAVEEVKIAAPEIIEEAKAAAAAEADTAEQAAPAEAIAASDAARVDDDEGKPFWKTPAGMIAIGAAALLLVRGSR